MFIKSLKECKKIIAGDKCVLRELLHPGKADLKLRYSLAHAEVAPGQITTKHNLKTSEVYYILEGTGIMFIDSEQKKVCSGDAVYIPPKAVQCIKNTGKKTLKFLCIVDPAWRKEDETIMPKDEG